MAEWNTTEDGKQIDVIFNEIDVGTDSQFAKYIVHIVPVEEAVRDDWRLKFFITGAEQVE